MDNLHGKRWIGVTAPSTHRYSTLFCQTVKLNLLMPLPVERSPIHIESSLSRSTSALTVMLGTYSQFRANNNSPRIPCTYLVYNSTDWTPNDASIPFHSTTENSSYWKKLGPRNQIRVIAPNDWILLEVDHLLLVYGVCGLSHYPYSRYGVYL